MASSRLPVLIIGTGPSALLLAHSLLRASPPIPFKLFEKDQSLTHRSQGYRFRVTGQGVTSCRRVLSPEHFTLLQATCADAQAGGMKRVEATTGDILPNGMGNKPAKKEEPPLVAERTLMRRVLFKGLEKYTTFGKQLVDYKESSDESASESTTDTPTASDPATSIVINFADGTTERGALLVGADGGFSKVRAQLIPDVKLLDTSMRMAFGRTPLSPELEQKMGTETYDKLTKGTCLINSPSKMFFMCESMQFGQRETAKTIDAEVGEEIPYDYIYWALALRSEQPEAQGINWRSLSADDTADLTVRLTEDWDPSLRGIILEQDRAQTLPLFSGVMPTPLARWRDDSKDSNGPLVTLIGDAAHAMPPTAGVGATTALTDAANLGAALAEHGLTTHALEQYESQMREYGTKAIVSGLQNGKFFLPGLRDVSEMEPMERDRASGTQW